MSDDDISDGSIAWTPTAPRWTMDGIVHERGGGKCRCLGDENDCVDHPGCDGLVHRQYTYWCDDCGEEHERAPRPVGSFGGPAPSPEAIRSERAITMDGLAPLVSIEGVTNVEVLIEHGEEYLTEVRWSWRGGHYGLKAAFGAGRDLAKIVVVRARTLGGLPAEAFEVPRRTFKVRP